MQQDILQHPVSTLTPAGTKKTARQDVDSTEKENKQTKVKQCLLVAITVYYELLVLVYSNLLFLFSFSIC